MPPPRGPCRRQLGTRGRPVAEVPARRQLLATVVAAAGRRRVLSASTPGAAHLLTRLPHPLRDCRSAAESTGQRSTRHKPEMKEVAVDSVTRENIQMN